MAKPRVGILVGSLRKGSYNKIIAHEMAHLLQADIKTHFIEIGQLPFYDEDLDEEDTVPNAWKLFREQAAAMDAFLFVTPEYNRSMPAALKNALDVGSRPYGQSVWDAKPGAVISVSVGQTGGFGANHHLRQSLTCLNVYVMQQPEAYFSNIEDALQEDNTVSQRTKEFLEKIAQAFISWVQVFVKTNGGSQANI